MATSNAATTYLENKLLAYIFKNDAGSFSSPGDSIYVGWLPLSRMQRQGLSPKLPLAPTHESK